MALDPLSAALELGTSVINKIWPDPVKQAEEQRKLQELFQKKDLAELQAQVSLLTGQLRINEKEAEHPSVFVAGWRPFIGWVGGCALAYGAIVEPLLRFIATMSGYKGAFPVVDTAAVVSVVMGMLGMGAMRSFDKLRGTGTSRTDK